MTVKHLFLCLPKVDKNRVWYDISIRFLMCHHFSIILYQQKRFKKMVHISSTLQDWNENNILYLWYHNRQKVENRMKMLYRYILQEAYRLKWKTTFYIYDFIIDRKCFIDILKKWYRYKLRVNILFIFIPHCYYIVKAY